MVVSYVSVDLGNTDPLLLNTDCCVGVLRDWMEDQVKPLLPDDEGELEVDLYDRDDQLQLLWTLPPRARAKNHLLARGLFHVATRCRDMSDDVFKPLVPPSSPEKQSNLRQKMARYELHALLDQTEGFPGPVAAVELVRRRLGKLPGDQVTSRMAALETLLESKHKETKQRSSSRRNVKPGRKSNLSSTSQSAVTKSPNRNK